MGSAKKALAGDELIALQKHATFYAVAFTNYLEAKKLHKKRSDFRKDIAKKGNELTEDDHDRLAVWRVSEERVAVTAVIFSAFALEAFINDYAISSFSRNFFKSYLDKLSPLVKWAICPWLKTGKRISTDGQAFELLQELFAERNDLAHYKSSVKRSRDIAKGDFLAAAEASRAIRAVVQAATELKKLDSSIDIRWLTEAEHVPLE